MIVMKTPDGFVPIPPSEWFPDKHADAKWKGDRQIEIFLDEEGEIVTAIETSRAIGRFAKPVAINKEIHIKGLSDLAVEEIATMIKDAVGRERKEVFGILNKIDWLC
jgi:hypothetical protein